MSDLDACARMRAGPFLVVAELSLQIAGGLDAPSEARTALRRFHPELPPELLQVVTLLVSELVANAVRHARAAKIALRFSVVPEFVRVEVADEGPGFDPAAAPVARGGPGGWGLRLVDELASRWGVADVHGDAGARVWFEVDR